MAIATARILTKFVSLLLPLKVRKRAESVHHHNLPEILISPLPVVNDRKSGLTLSDSDFDEGNVLGSIHCKYSRKEAVLKRELKQKDQEIEYYKATFCQYRCKFQKVRNLSMAGIARDDMINESANADMECGISREGEVKSDPEDDDKGNKVEYSYIDNELFLNED